VSTIKSSGENLKLSSDNTKDIELQHNGSTKVTVKSDGKVGIGITPTEKLQVNGNILINRSHQLIGGMGARSTSGTADWNHSTNARSGMGFSLLLGTASNGMGGGNYYHSFCFEYSGSVIGANNMTQLAIPYGTTQQYIRRRYSGVWSSWSAV
jgi:hypothetical protein